MIAIHQDDLGKSGALSGAFPDKGMKFNFNPEAVRVTKTLKPKENKQAGGDAPALQFTGGHSAMIEFGEILFDGFDKRENVHLKYVSLLEKLITVDSDLHRPPLVFFSWGSGWGETKGQIHTGIYFCTGLDVNYTLFLPNGVPVRCTCKLTLQEAPKPKDKKSPDTAHVHLVSRGDSLQGIAAKEYDAPGEWRRIAQANGIDDPLNLEPGRRLLIPPILK
jgi:LysM repeat protein